MVSKCCWREPAGAKQSPELDPKRQQQKPAVQQANRVSNASSSTLINYEDECDNKLEITDLTKDHKSTGSCKRLVKFSTEESQVHEIPPKPKRTPKVEKRSKSANLEELKRQQKSSVESQAVAESVELGQRVSMTSMEDLKKFDTTANLNKKEKDDLNKVFLNFPAIFEMLRGRLYNS